MARSTIKTTAQRVLSELNIARGRGRTTQEIVNRYGLSRSAVSARLCEMVDEGLVVEDGTRVNDNGRTVTVYKLPTYA